MTELERFEKIVASDPFGYTTDKNSFGYKLFVVNELRAMWIAGRADAYKEVKACLESKNTHQSPD